MFGFLRGLSTVLKRSLKQSLCHRKTWQKLWFNRWALVHFTLFWAFPHSSRIHRYWIRKLENQCLNLQMTLVQLFQEAVYISFYPSLSKSTQIFQCFILFCMTMVRTHTHKHTYTHTYTGAQSHLRFPSLATLLHNLMRRRHAYTLCIYTGPLSICRGRIWIDGCSDPTWK